MVKGQVVGSLGPAGSQGSKITQWTLSMNKTRIRDIEFTTPDVVSTILTLWSRLDDQSVFSATVKDDIEEIIKKQIDGSLPPLRQAEKEWETVWK